MSSLSRLCSVSKTNASSVLYCQYHVRRQAPRWPFQSAFQGSPELEHDVRSQRRGNRLAVLGRRFELPFLLGEGAGPIVETRLAARLLDLAVRHYASGSHGVLDQHLPLLL